MPSNGVRWGRWALLLIGPTGVGLTLVAVFIPVLVTLSASDPVSAGTAASAGALGIRPVVLNAYKAAASRAPCKIGWWVLAGIGKVESSHAASSQIVTDGTLTTPILGPLLDGSTPGPSIVTLPDGSYDRAGGIVQFLGTTWATDGIRSASDGLPPDRQNIYDATLSAAAKLCRDGAGVDMSDPNADLTGPLLAYNHDAAYVADVSSWARYYAHFETDSTGNVFTAGLYALPVDPTLLTDKMLAEPHHDHPALDLPVPTGTPVFAVEGGQVDLTTDPACGQGFRLVSDSGDLWTYCHASEFNVKQGDRVTTGQQVMLSGASGEGVTGPHLHIQIADPLTGLYCPGPIFAQWLKGIPLAPPQLERTDCVG